MVRKTKVLVLASNPTDLAILEQCEEVQKIKNQLEDNKYFDLKVKLAVTDHELIDYLTSINPNIIHFSGHGNLKGEIYLRNKETKKNNPIKVKTMTNIFRALKEEDKDVTIKCVFLNACYSNKLAKAIAPYVGCVIGMKRSIDDRAAVQFAEGFYITIKNGKSVSTALTLGLEHAETILQKKHPELVKELQEPNSIHGLLKPKEIFFVKKTTWEEIKSGDFELEFKL